MWCNSPARGCRCRRTSVPRLQLDAARGRGIGLQSTRLSAWAPGGPTRAPPPASGPPGLPRLRGLLADHAGLQRLVSLVRAFLGYETGFAVNPVLAGPEVPALRLDRDAGAPPRLGWNTWIPAPEPAMPGIPRRDADDAIFEAEVVEAE